MIESLQARQVGSKDFGTIYAHLCSLQDTCPLTSVKANLSDGAIDLNVDRIRLPDWIPILNSLRINKTLRKVSLKSYYQKPVKVDGGKLATGQHQRSIHKPPPLLSKDVTSKMCTALKECLQVTESLELLSLQGIPLRRYDMQTIAKGLSKTRALHHLSMEYCRISHASVEVLCQAIQSSPCITSINLTGCGITKKGAEAISKLIKHQSTSRHSEAWKDSLRYRRPNLDQMPGLRRITLNNNPLINDSGALYIADALKDDLWLKALDMQHCGISNVGAVAILEALRGNTSVVVLDIRRNPLIDHSLLKEVIEQVLINGEGREEEYPWLTATSMEPPQKAPSGMVKKKRKGKKKERKSSPVPRPVQSKTSVTVYKERQPVTRPGPGFIPWRSAARAEERKRSATPADTMQPTTAGKTSGGVQSGSTIRIHHTPPRRRTSPKSNKSLSQSVVIEESSGSDGDDDDTTTKDESTSTTSQMIRRQHERENKEIMVRLEELKRRLDLESKARAAADAQIVELTVDNSRLRRHLQMLDTRHPILAASNQMLSSAAAQGMDEDLLKTIEESFQKFHSFLDLLRDAGLGQLCSLVGLSTSELQNPAVASILKNHQPSTSMSKGRQDNSTGFHTNNQSENVQPWHHNSNANGSSMVSNGVPSRTHSNGHISVFAPTSVTASGSHIGMRMGSDHDLASEVHPVISSTSTGHDGVTMIQHGTGGTHREGIPRDGADVSGKDSSSARENDNETRNNDNPQSTKYDTSPVEANEDLHDQNGRRDQRRERTLPEESKMRIELITVTEEERQEDETARNRNNSGSAFEEDKQASHVEQSPVSSSMIVKDPSLITPDALKSGRIPRDATSFRSLIPEDVTLPEVSKDEAGLVQEESDPHANYSDDDDFESSQSDHSKIKTSTPEKTLSELSREEILHKSDELPSQVDDEDQSSNSDSRNQNK